MVDTARPLPHRPRFAPPRWLVIACFWVVQALLIMTTVVLWLAAMEADDLGEFLSIFGDAWLALTTQPEPEVAMFWAVIAALTALQAVYLWPVRKPSIKGGGGTSVFIAIGVAGLFVAMMVLAMVFALMEVLGGPTELLDREPAIVLGTDAAGLPYGIHLGWIVLATLGVSWAVATPLLVTFCRRGSREKQLSRISAALFLGTIVETAAIIPLDVMVRRREPCYCATGTFFALIMTGGVGLLVLGPAMLIPLLARRRKRWYADRCEVCGYDLRGLNNPDRCPECGAGWASRGATRPAPHAANQKSR